MCGSCEDSVKLVMAKDIPFVKTGNRSIYPIFFEDTLINRCKSEGFVFLGWEIPWKGVRTKFWYTCPNGHTHPVSYYSFVNGGRRCSECSGRLKLTKEKAIKNINKSDPKYTFNRFDGEFKGAHTKFWYTCPNGHTHPISYNSFVNHGSRCPECSGKLKHTEEKAIKNINKVDPKYKFLRFDGEFKGALTRFWYTCPNGHTHSAVYDKFVNGGRRCPECVSRLKLTKEKAIKNINKVDPKYKFLRFDGEFKGNETKFWYTCPNGHTHPVKYSSFVSSGSRCPSCAEYGYRPNKPGSIYIQKLMKDGVLCAVKFGITNKTSEHRMSQQNRKSIFIHELFDSFHFEDGNKALEIEKAIKLKYKNKTGYVSRNDMEDGFTETVPPELLSSIVFEIKNQMRN